MLNFAGVLSDIHVNMDYHKASDYSVAIWLSRIATFSVEASTYTTAGGWTAPVKISDPAMNASNPLYVCVNDFGDAVALWFFFDTVLEITSIASATLTSGGSWSLPVVISGTHDVAKSSSVIVKLSNTGNLTATWSAFVGSNQKVFGATGTFPFWTNLSTVQLSP